MFFVIFKICFPSYNYYSLLINICFKKFTINKLKTELNINVLQINTDRNWEN